jgi:hypothetical protein
MELADDCTGCFKASVTVLRARILLLRGHVQSFTLS